jgi:outer membrane protein OmpA-like peptidoglycan-associated protein
LNFFARAAARPELMRHIAYAITATAAAILLTACARHDAPAPVVTVSPTKVQPKAETPPHAKQPPKPSTAKTANPEKEVATEGIEPAQVGYYFDVLQGRLQQQAGPDIAISRRSEAITLDLTRRLHFANDDAQLSPADCAGLAPLASVFVEYRMTRVIIEVSAGESGDAAGKAARSHAQSIAKCLGNAGVAAKRIEVRDAAETRASTQHSSTLLQLEAVVRTN